MDVKAVTPTHFVPMLAGAIAAPVIASVTPIGRLGAYAPLAAGAALAYFGKGQVRAAGQGAVLVSAVGLLAPMIGGLLGGNKSSGDAQVREAF